MNSATAANSRRNASTSVSLPPSIPGSTASQHTIFLIAEGANFYPSFLKMNPNGSLPTLATPGKIYTTTAEVVRYLVENAPKPAGASSDTDLIENLHVASIDPNFSMLSTVSVSKHHFVCYSRPHTARGSVAKPG